MQGTLALLKPNSPCRAPAVNRNGCGRVRGNFAAISEALGAHWGEANPEGISVCIANRRSGRNVLVGTRRCPRRSDAIPTHKNIIERPCRSMAWIWILKSEGATGDSHSTQIDQIENPFSR